LSVVHGIVKSVGGGITVQSELGKGSEFCLYFPASHSNQNDRSRPSLSSEPNRGTGKRVLYVDDDSSLVLLVERMLSKSGYIVSGATDPTQALAEFAAHPDVFDAVVTDLSMPGMSGFAFAQEILAIRPNLPVFMTSGYVRPDDEEQARNVGIRNLILKPSTLEELQVLLNRLFDEALVEG
jgi:CheY-like chemotaxis protein